MKKALIILPAWVVLSVVAFSCAKSDSPEPISPSACDNIPKNFTTDVNPIIQTYCNQVACHNPGSINGPGALTNYTEIFNARANIKAQVQAGLMPQNTTLSTAQKNIIICWIDSGAPNN